MNEIGIIQDARGIVRGLIDCVFLLNVLVLLAIVLEGVLGNEDMQIDELLVQYTATSSIRNVVLDSHITFLIRVLV